MGVLESGRSIEQARIYITDLPLFLWIELLSPNSEEQNKGKKLDTLVSERVSTKIKATTFRVFTP